MQYLAKEHINHVIIRYYIQKAKIVVIYDELKADRLEGEKVNEFGVVPVTKLSKNYFYRKVHNIKSDLIKEVKDNWLNDLLEIPLANKKVRVLELQEMYNRETDGKLQTAILKSIKEEVGESGLLEAIKESGTNVTVGSNIPDDILKELITAYLTREDDDS